jgi:predicted CopG family antitoxin
MGDAFREGGESTEAISVGQIEPIWSPDLHNRPHQMVGQFKQKIDRVAQQLLHVNANVDVIMATADKQIRVSDRVKRQLDRRRREGESYNDVIDRLLGGHTAADFYDGFGTISDHQADWIRERRETAKEDRKRRMRGLERS